MTRDLISALTALALITATGSPAAAQDKSDISFGIGHVEDRYALNLPVLRDIFRLLDFGYAGCSVELAVTSKIGKMPPGANPKIQVDYVVQLAPGTPPYSNNTVGSIARRSVPIYLNEKCAEVSNIKISGAACFAGFKGQWSKLTCPYNFRVTSFSIPDYYDRNQ
ncbi:MAG: hypothetical protein HQ514_13070 [Rhodospirillales bacterium]|nr:hypothetical protein [Rhodospirillales bacterium]